MPSTRCGPFTLLRRASVMLVVLAAAHSAAGAPGYLASSDLERAWVRAVQALEPLDLPTLQERIDEVFEAGRRSELKRLTPMALALHLRARTLDPHSAESVLVQARRLDPVNPEVELALAELKLRRGAVAAGLVGLLRAGVFLGTDLRLATAMRGSLLLATMLSLAVLFVGWSALAVRRAIPRLWHDLLELGYRLRLDRNTPVFAFLLLLLPLFLGFDLLWMAAWIWAMAWAYFTAGQKLIGILGMILLAATPTLVELGFRDLSRPANPVLECADALSEARYHPKGLEALLGLSDLLGSDPGYHKLRGDVLQQAGLLEPAAAAFTEGARLSPNSGELALSLGVVRFLQGDFNSAVQALNTARQAGADPVIVNFNLSLAFAQTYLFRESDEAMAAARAADEGRFRALSWGRDQQPIRTVFSRRDGQTLLARQDPVELLTRGIASPPLARAQTLWQPLTLAGLLALLLALPHALVRERLTGFASSCLRCGRAFCRRCKLSTESQSYCTQCVNIFLKKDMVAIETQVAKRRQLQRRDLLLQLERRFADLLLPGLGLVFAGRTRLGGALLVAALGVGVTGLLWYPYFVAPALLHDPRGPVLVFSLVLWIGLAALAQAIPSSRR